MRGVINVTAQAANMTTSGGGLSDRNPKASILKVVEAWHLRCTRPRGAAPFPIKANPPRDGDAKPRVRPRA